MKTLYLRNVPDDVVQRLERLAERDKTSVSAVAVRELAEASRRVDNPALLGELPDLNVDVAELVGDIEAERGADGDDPLRPAAPRLRSPRGR